jgi:hypothetical protein
MRAWVIGTDSLWNYEIEKDQREQTDNCKGSFLGISAKFLSLLLMLTTLEWDLQASNNADSISMIWGVIQNHKSESKTGMNL